VSRKEAWESASPKWIHEIRESQYRATRGLRLEAWLKPVDPERTARACRRMGLKVRLYGGTRRRRVGKQVPGSS